MNITDLSLIYFIYGNKGNLWNNTAHLAKIGYSSTLCGIPMLSTNHCKLNNITTVGCEKCINIYNDNILKDAKILVNEYNNILNNINILKQACNILLIKNKYKKFRIVLDNLDELSIYKIRKKVFLKNEHDTYLELDNLSFGELESIYQNIINT